MTQIRTVDINGIETLAEIIRESFKDVAERFNLTPFNCAKHLSNCTEEWIRNDLARGRCTLSGNATMPLLQRGMTTGEYLLLH